MDKDTFLQNLETSVISAERKQQIKDRIAKEGWNIDTIEYAKDLIQADIESDGMVFTPEDQAAISAANDELVTGLNAIEQTLATDMHFVDTELADLEQSAKELEKGMDQAQIDALKQDLTTL